MSMYSFTDGKWKRKIPIVSTTGDGEEVTDWEWMHCSITNVPVEVLLNEYDNLLRELSQKEEKLIEVEEEWKEKEFHFRFISDIDFKELYGKANDDVRKYHARSECRDLLEKKHDLGLSIDYLKRYIKLLNKVLGVKII